MRSFRSLVLGLVLVILSPLGWGEDVYYCVEEQHLGLRADTKNSAGFPDEIPLGGTFQVKHPTKRFTLKFDPIYGRGKYGSKGRPVLIASGGHFTDTVVNAPIVFESRWGDTMSPTHPKDTPHFISEEGVYGTFNFINGTHFFFSSSTTTSARISSGTCTKF